MTAAERWMDEQSDVTEIDGELVHAAVTVDLDVDSIVRIRRLDADPDTRQGLVVDADAPLRVNGVDESRFVLWADVAPDEVEVHAPAGRLTFWNVWETDGAVHAWIGEAGIMLDELDDGTTRLQASDGHGERTVDLEVEITIDAA